MALRVLDEWLGEGDAAEGDFAAHVLHLATTGGLARSGRYLLDVPALTQPFSCETRECAPGHRTPAARSCCADVAVSLSTREQRAITAAMPRLDPFMRRRDARWRTDASLAPIDADGTLGRPGRRCAFALERGGGLRCGLQLAERAWRLRSGALKPVPCRLFPVVIVDLGDGQRLLTAVSRRVASLVGTFPAARFPCLRGDIRRKPLHVALAPTLRALLGDGPARRIAKALRTHG